jgi:hypothetical protein
MAHRALVGTPEDSIEREEASTFVLGVRDQDAKHHLFTGFEMSLNKTLNCALKLDYAKAIPDHQRSCGWYWLEPP